MSQLPLELHPYNVNLSQITEVQDFQNIREQIPFACTDKKY